MQFSEAFSGWAQQYYSSPVSFLWLKTFCWSFGRVAKRKGSGIYRVQIYKLKSFTHLLCPVSLILPISLFLFFKPNKKTRKKRTTINMKITSYSWKPMPMSLRDIFWKFGFFLVGLHINIGLIVTFLYPIPIQQAQCWYASQFWLLSQPGHLLHADTTEGGQGKR